MQRQNLYFIRRRVSQLRRALFRHVCGNRNLTRQSQPSERPLRIRRKRQDVRLFVLPPKLPIQGPHFRATGHKQIDRALESGGSARAKQKSFQPRFAQACNRFLQNYQLASASSADFLGALCGYVFCGYRIRQRSLPPNRTGGPAPRPPVPISRNLSSCFDPRRLGVVSNRRFRRPLFGVRYHVRAADVGSFSFARLSFAQ